MTPITFMIAGRNSAPYHKLCYESVRKNLDPMHEVILISDGSTDGTAAWIDSVQDSNCQKLVYKEQMGIPHTYNSGVAAAKNDWVCLLHSDMYVPKGFDVALERYMDKLDFISTMRVEPPVYAKSDDKLTKDFGLYHNAFDVDGFNEFVKQNAREATQKGMFFPWCIRKALYNQIGGCDELFAKYMVEDDDMYLRIKQAGGRYAQILDTMVYHFGSRSSKFNGDNLKTDGSAEWNDQYMKSARNFIRKWGTVTMFCYDSAHEMYLPPKHTIGYILKNASPAHVEAIEPFGAQIVTDVDITEYLATEQKRTLIPLAPKFVKELTTDVQVEVDCKEVDMNSLPKLPFAIKKVGVFKLKGLLINVKRIAG